jgi:propionyl-CoA carboxylase alpha chain
MSGTVAKVNVKPGEVVSAFQVLLVMEAMKMEHAIVAPYPGTITAVKTQAGRSVMAGDVLAEISEG